MIGNLMRRIRWYHFYFLLAIFNVVVIALTLRLHQQSVDWVRDLLDAEHQVDGRVKWLQQAQRFTSELNAPGNNLFQADTAADYERQRRLLAIASRNMDDVIRRATEFDFDVTRIASEVRLLEEEAANIFRIFEPLQTGGNSAMRRAEMIVEAGPAMARMDRHQHRALELIGMLANQTNQTRIDMIQRAEADIQHQFVAQSFVFAAIFLILVGVFVFGRRLQAADRLLTLERQRVKEAQRERLAAVGELCSSVAHGIRNPLAAIRSSAQLALEMGELDGDSRERIQDILDEGQRLGDRVTGLLSMARANADAFNEIDLTQIVEVGVKGLLPEMERRGLVVEMDVSDSPVLVQGDRARLEQAVVELLSNAMEHSPQDGTIQVRCQMDGQTAKVEIEDDGAGIPAPIRERVFDLFFTTKPTGTGIGLATVKRIARLHGGDVSLADVSGGGARFVIALPKASELVRLKLTDDAAA